MKPLQLGMKLVGLIEKPVSMFFGSDERGFITMLGLVIFAYVTGYSDLSIILSVYSTIFAYSGMEKYNSTGNSSGSSQDLEEMQEMMDDALGMAQEFTEQKEEEEKK